MTTLIAEHYYSYYTKTYQIPPPRMKTWNTCSDWSLILFATWMIQGSNPGRENTFFSPLRHTEWLWSALSLRLNGHRGSFLWVTWLGCELDHSPPSSAEVKNERKYISSPPIWSHGVDRENFKGYTRNGIKIFRYFNLN